MELGWHGWGLKDLCVGVDRVVRIEESGYCGDGAAVGGFIGGGMQ